jgi:hypothetical protein
LLTQSCIARAAIPGSRSAPREFGAIAMAFIPLWLVFEGYYLGFPPFAIECFTMYVFVRALYVNMTSQRHRGRAIVL